MTDVLQALVQDLEVRRRQGAGAGCLSDVVLQGLVDGSLPPPELGVVQEHLRSCLACLHAYAFFQGLVDLATADTPLVGGDADRGVVARVKAAAQAILKSRLPLPGAIGVAAALVLLTWMVATSVDRSGGRSPLPQSLPAPTELSGQGARTVSGTVEEMRDTSAEGVATHVVRLKDAAGATYTVFVWGSPKVNVGDKVTVEGVFSPLDQAGGGPFYKGVASDVRKLLR